jgi:hypothetical protein
MKKSPLVFIQRFQEIAKRENSKGSRSDKTATATREQTDQSQANERLFFGGKTGLKKRIIQAAKTHTFVQREEPDQRHASALFTASRQNPRASTATQTRTGREEPDQRYSGGIFSTGSARPVKRSVKTITETREQLDQRKSQISALIKTATKTREEREQNEPVSNYRALSSSS